MKKGLLFFFLLFSITSVTNAQDFVTQGKIEFEIKRHTQKLIPEKYREQYADYFATLPEYNISYFDLIFSGNQSVFKKGRELEPASNQYEEKCVFTDLDKQQIVKKTPIVNEYVLFEDSIRNVKWKIENETRKIAGWECRKAVGRIQDSVYVVAFYCPEIIPQLGPELFTGLPGMILGIAIPRYYTTWFATKVELANIDESKIAPPTDKKLKLYHKKELGEIIFKKNKASGNWKDITIEKVMELLNSYTN